MASVK